MSQPDAEPDPNTVRFSPEVMGNVTLYAKGRNGMLAAHGINVTPWGGPDIAVALFNVTSKGNTSDAARLVLPVTAIPELVEILLRFYAGPLGRQALDL